MRARRVGSRAGSHDALSPRDTELSATTPLILAALCVFALALVWICAALIGPLHREDAVVLETFTGLERPRLDRAATSLTSLLDPLLFAVWSGGLALVAAARRRPRIALAIVAIVTLAPLTTEVLKLLLAHRHAAIGRGLSVPAASWPSGHSTAALALALCATLASPSRLRPFVAVVGALFALSIGFCQLLLARHMPSDVLGGYLVAMFWTALAVALLRPIQRDPQLRT